VTHRFHTRDGQYVGVGDRVWSQNHWPWVIVRIESMGGSDWAHMEHHEVGHDTLMMMGDDFATYIFKSHPPQGCRQAGCQYRPWGAR
jgi:hypothetical protein